MSINISAAVPNPNLLPIGGYVVDKKFWGISLAIEVMLCAAVLFLTIHTIFRTCLNLKDPQYERGKTYLKIQRQIRANEVDFGDGDSSILEDQQPLDARGRQRDFLQIQRRFLTNLPYLIFGIICINSFTSLTLQIILWSIAIGIFIFVNILFHSCMPQIARVVFIFVCLATPIPFYSSQHRFGNY